MKTQDDFTKKTQQDGPEENGKASPTPDALPQDAAKDPSGKGGAISSEGDVKETVGKGGKIGGTKAVSKTPDPIQEVQDAKSADNLGAGEKNLTNNSTLNTVPAVPVEVDPKAPKCDHCKGEGLENPEDPNTGLCTVCQGTGRKAS